MAAFSTSRNRPSVSTVIGSVRMKASGRTKALTMPSRMAAIASLAGDAKCRPSNSWLATQRPSALIAARRMKSHHGELLRDRGRGVDLATMVMESPRPHTTPTTGEMIPWNTSRWSAALALLQYIGIRHAGGQRPRQVRRQGAGGHRSRGLRALFPRAAEHARTAGRDAARDVAVRAVRERRRGQRGSALVYLVGRVVYICAATSRILPAAAQASGSASCRSWCSWSAR